MRALFVVAFLLAAAMAQRRPGGDREDFENFRDFFENFRNDDVIDFVHNYRFEEFNEDTGEHLIIAISEGDSNTNRSCHIIEVNQAWEGLLTDDTYLEQVTEEIYHLIDSGMAQETTMTRDELRDKYGDREIMRECFRHQVYILTYIPSITTAAP